jgi:hypothetical protein
MRRASLHLVRSRSALVIRGSLILILVASVATSIPGLAVAKDQSRDPGFVDAPPPPPPLSDALREPVRADVKPQGEFSPTVVDLKAPADPSKLTQGLVEDPTKRSENGSVYELNGGDHLVVVYPRPVNFQNEQGEWVSISTDLVTDQKGGQKNEANAFTTDFPGALSESAPVEVTPGQGKLHLHPQGPGSARRPGQGRWQLADLRWGLPWRGPHL